MRQFLRLVWAAALLGTTMGIGHAESSSAFYDFSPLTSQVQEWIGKGYYRGAALIVAKYASSRPDKTLYKRTFGAYKPDERVYIASSGKWLAAATIASVVDSGTLSWDDQAGKWIPALAGDPKGQATLRQLLSHTSGYPPYQPDGQPVDDFQTLSESVKHILPLPLHYPPGTHFEYGGEAMQVAGRMAEIATNEDWETLFKNRIGDPCGMPHTSFTPVDTAAGGHAPMLGGAARSTLTDYANFLSMIAHDGVFHGKRVLSLSAVRAMQADQVGGAIVAPGQEFVERARGEVHNAIYGLGEWREELGPDGSAELISSPSWAGAYPWLDKSHHLYGFFLAHVDIASPAVARDHFSSFYASPRLAVMVRDVIDMAGMPPVERSMTDIGGGVHLYTERAGHGPVVIFLHAHSLDCNEWTPQFAALSHKFTVIRYDLRGYGKSDLPVEGQAFTHADDLYRLMLAHHIVKANLVGLSLGALVVTDFLAQHPSMVNSAVVASGAIHDAPIRTGETPADAAADAAREKAAAAPAVNAADLEVYKRQWFSSLMANCSPQNQEAVRPSVWLMISDWTGWQPSHVEADVLVNTPVVPLIEAEKPTAPVLVVMGKYDSPGSHQSSARLLAADPNARAVTIDDAGHLSNMESPNKFTTLLERFLAQAPRMGGGQ